MSAKSLEVPLLAPFHGSQPEAPEWFPRALAVEPERGRVDIGKGVEIETLSWGEPDRPGLLLLHGNAAHADWWSFIAPFFCDDFRVVAFSWSGMGHSGWRDSYSVEIYADELHAVAEATGLFRHHCKPVVVAHSFGSFPSFLYAATRGENLRALISLDTPVLSPAQRATRKRSVRTGDELQPHKIYRSVEDALCRYRFLPPQRSENLYIVDYVARRSLRQVPSDDSLAEGYVWSFDPYLWRELRLSDPTRHVPSARCPVAFVTGAESSLMTKEARESIRRYAPAGSPILEIPAAHHHLMIDQPLALVCALRGLLSVWPNPLTSPDLSVSRGPVPVWERYMGERL